MIGLSSLNHVVRQAFHMREVAKPESEAPGQAPSALKQQLKPFVVKNNPLAPAAPAAPSDLKVMSFNVRLGGMDYPGIKKTLADAKPDMVGLQECSRETAEKLAKEFGYHLTFYSSMRHNNSAVNGKAILSKYPIKEAETQPFKLSIGDRLKTMWSSFQRKEGSLFERLAGVVSLWQKRTILRSTYQINGKTIDFIDTHLTTGSPKNTATQFKQLQAYVEARKQLGHEVILVGDFNTHFQKPAGTDDSTRALAALQSTVTDAYTTAPDVKVKGLDGQVMTPAEAAEKLKTPGLSKEEKDVLQRIVIGSTLASGKGRIDTILSSGGLKATQFTIDQHNAASDHEPLWATLSLQ